MLKTHKAQQWKRVNGGLPWLCAANVYIQERLKSGAVKVILPYRPINIEDAAGDNEKKKNIHFLNFCNSLTTYINKHESTDSEIEKKHLCQCCTGAQNITSKILYFGSKLFFSVTESADLRQLL